METRSLNKTKVMMSSVDSVQCQGAVFSYVQYAKDVCDWIHKRCTGAMVTWNNVLIQLALHPVH